jgi:Uma2 family endonuclease
MSGVPRNAKAATYEDLKALPANVTGELISGALYAHPRPAIPHARASSALGGLLLPPWRFGRGGPGGWLILDEPELHCSTDVVVPDLGGWKRDRMPEQPEAAFIALAPDWLCEVLSPSTAGHDRVRKLAVYLREGVRHVWFIDPLAQTLEVMRLEEGKWIVAGNFTGDAKVRAEPFEAVELELGFLWEK